MKSELENQLMIDFPWMEARNIWTGKKLGYGKSCECGDGWYQLIHDLCQEIEEHYKSRNVNINSLRIEQVKEKFGGLRFYVGGYIEGTDKIIDKYEELSFKTCEVCGEVGELMIKGCWLKTMCQKHADEFGYIKVED